MDDAELRSKLAARAGSVNLTEAFFPEPAANGKQRVIVDDDRTVFSDFTNPRSLKLSGDLATVLVEEGANITNGAGFLLEQYFSSDRFHIRIRERDADREAVHQLLQKRDVGKGALAGADDHDMTVELLPARTVLRDLRNALAHGGVAYLDDDGRQSDGAAVMLAFVGTNMRRGQLVSFNVLRVAEEEFCAFLMAWADWLSAPRVRTILNRLDPLVA